MSDVSDPDFNEGWKSCNYSHREEIQELKDRIFDLEDGVAEARSTISFLHGCLTDPIYKYAYPQMTLDRLQELDKLVPPREYCIHSFTKEGCEGCEQRNAHFRKRAEVDARRNHR